MKTNSIPKVNQGRGVYVGKCGASLVTPDHFAMQARCNRLKRALKENLKDYAK